MALDRKKLQKKKAKQAAKAKSRRLKASARQPAGEGKHHTAIAAALNAPVYECWMPQKLFQNPGIGSVVFSRSADGGNILAAGFLLDVYCLGVKDAFIRLMTPADYTVLLDRFRGYGPLEAIEPACARKLVESAEAYARDLGFSAYKDYRKSRRIFSDIDGNDCPHSFTFGFEGKPLFSAGPHDRPGKVKRVIRTLEKRCGKGGFHFLTPVASEDLDGYV